MAKINYQELWLAAGSVFTPGSPVSERDLFAGRPDQINRIMEAVSQRGFHAVLYGDRGVGKTSLANVLPAFLQELGATVLFARANCDATDDFSSLWRKILQEITLLEVREGIGFSAKQQASHRRLVDDLPQVLRPDDIRRALAFVGQSLTLVVAIDEFDRLTNRTVPALVADTIKTLSDAATPATVILIGVADSVDQLIEGHRSIERALVQVSMPRMSRAETEQIVLKGVQRLGMTVTKEATAEIIRLSQGLPYVTHMLSLYSARAALEEKTLAISSSAVQAGIRKSLEQWQESIKTAYYDATRSPQPDHLYKEVLLACALADVDDKSFFTAAAVRGPLRVVAARPDLDIPNFARHLKEMSDARRGRVLVREGETRRLRYRFVNPLMRPYVIMRGVADGLLTNEKRDSISSIA
jgi:Cdc6-like AAA superfamily ATPase